MKYNIWAVPRQAFCWLEDSNVIVISKDKKNDNGDCELLNTVSLVVLKWVFFVNVYKSYKKKNKTMTFTLG